MSDPAQSRSLESRNYLSFTPAKREKLRGQCWHIFRAETLAVTGQSDLHDERAFTAFYELREEMQSFTKMRESLEDRLLRAQGSSSRRARTNAITDFEVSASAQLDSINEDNQTLPHEMRFPGTIDQDNIGIIASSHIAITDANLRYGQWVNRYRWRETEGARLSMELMQTRSITDADQRIQRQAQIRHEQETNDILTQLLRDTIRDIMLLEMNSFQGTEFENSLGLQLNPVQTGFGESGGEASSSFTGQPPPPGP